MPTSATAAHKPTPAKPGKALASRAPAKPAPAPKSAAHAAPLRAPALPPFARPDGPATKPGVTAAQPHAEAHSPTARMAPGPAATTAHPRAGAVPGPLKPAALKASTPAPRLAPSAKPKPKLSALGPPKTPAAGGGQPMPAHIQEAIQNSLFVDLSAVRLHASTAAQRKAQSLKARAFTFGNDIFLGHGEHPTDLTLITHEAAHVIQQQSVVEAQAWSTSSNDRFEREANQAAVAVGRGERFEVRERVDRPRVQRLGISDALDYFADKAYNIPGYRMFTIVLGVNPINMQSVERSAANILRAVVEFIPGGALITQALDKYGVFDKVGNWVQDQIDSLAITGASIGKAIMDFLDSLSWRDIFHLGDVWERAKRIFSEPIDRIKNFVVNLLEGIWKFVRDAILKPIAKLAEGTSGWPLLTAVLGSNPITGEKVERNAETLIGGFMKLIHQDEIWENIKKSGAIARAWSWFQGTLTELMGFISQIPDLFKQALKTLEWSDILDLPGGFMKVAGVFGKFLGNFISWAGEKIWNLLEIIFDVVAPSVMPYLRKVGAAFRKIIKDPIGFVRHLVAAAKLGIENFAKNFFDHLKKALIDWLTGSLPGVYIPKAFTLLEFGKFALSVLGISWAQIRAKIVKALGPNGETIMKGIETTFDVVVALVTGGPAAAWEVIKDKLTNLKDMVIDGIVGFVEDTIIKKAIPKLVSLFIPGAGFISAIVSIYDTVMVFVQKLAKIAAVVKSFVDSIVDIANGQIEGAAAKVESALEGLLSLVISFLAGFLGLGNIAAKILGVIEKVRAAVDKALDTAITWIVTKAKALFATLASKAKSVAGAVAGWWKDRQQFQADDGSTHTLLFKGDDENAALVFESTPTDLAVFVGGLKDPTPEQATLAAAIKADIDKINTIRTFKKKDPSAQDLAQVQKDRDAVQALLVSISLKIGKLVGGDDFATEAKPLPLGYPKPPGAAYAPVYIGPKTDVTIPQSTLAAAQGDKAQRQSLAAMVAKKDPAAEQNWKARGYSIETFSPAAPKPLPESGPTIGLGGDYQTHVGQKLKLPKTAGSTPGGHVINDALGKYGYAPSVEHTDGDHVVEIQLGGVNEFPNLWPLNSRVNQQAGSRISKAQLAKPDGKTTVSISDLKKMAAKRDVWLVIAQTE